MHMQCSNHDNGKSTNSRGFDIGDVSHIRLGSNVAALRQSRIERRMVRQELQTIIYPDDLKSLALAGLAARAVRHSVLGL